MRRPYRRVRRELLPVAHEVFVRAALDFVGRR
jgi:hypothetical protein